MKQNTRTNNDNKQTKELDHLSAETVQTIAEAFGFVLSDDVAKAFAPDCEYRLRDVVQEGLKCMKRSRRTKLTTEVLP
jgi:transcription initiation factor TFIID subunit 6